jgi:hypothetical protein
MEMVRKFAKKLLFVLLSSQATGPVGATAHSELAGDITVARRAVARA